MKQFYDVAVPEKSTAWVELVFDAPVRKARIAITSNAYIGIAKTGEEPTTCYRFSAGNQEFDFQSANTGKGITSLFVRALTDTASAFNMYVSVTEYGSNGDNEYFV